jgi:ribosome biogenesis GTPase
VKPLLIFNKLDLCGHPAELESRIENRFPGITSRFVSCRTGAGLDTVRETLLARNSYAFVGPSGVGKSTIINLLFGGQVQKTAPVRAGDHKGRHITSARQLFLSPSGAILVDTPGLRELALTGEQSSLAEVYTAIADAARNCRYSDCSHTVEQGCAVREGVDNGGIPRDQYETYLKMRRELQHLERKERQAGGYNAKKRWKSISKEIRRLKKWKT